MFDPLRDQDPVEIGGYRLRARLGGGGMGEVFLAFGESGRPLAIKVLRREFADDRTFRSRFGQEVRAARQVSGPGIAPLLDADPDAETPWLATAYVAGPTLADAVELYGPMPVSAVIVLISGIAASLAAIHDTGIVHRDLKPANVLLGPDGLRVIDFGIARAADATPLTLTGMLVGSPQYVAPEQVLGEPPTPAGDVFSLGALAHYAATGRPAFGGGPKFGVVYRIVNEQPDLAGCPLQIRSLIESCLAKNPAQRPSTAEIMEICTPDEPAPYELQRGAADWLPQPVVFAIESYRTALAELAVGGRDRDEGDGARAAQPTRPKPQRADKMARYRRPSRRAVYALTTAAAILAAAAGLVLAASPGGTRTSALGSSSPAAQADGGQGGEPGGGPPPGADRPPAPPTVREWSGTIKFTAAGMWLDQEPPAAATGSVRGDVREAAPAPLAEISSNSPQVRNLALWAGSGVPDGVQCRDTAIDHGTWRLHVSAGDVVCALTAHRRVAVLRILAFPADGSGVTAAATVWGDGAR